MARVQLAVLLSLSMVTQGSAQSVPQIRLAPPDARLDGDGFTYIASLRELPDGRVLLTDQWQRQFVVGDLRAGTVTPVGRVGDGPSEFRNVGDLWALGGDTTIMIDDGKAEWLMLSGTQVVAKWTRASSTIARVVGNRPADGVDLGGRVVWSALAPRHPVLGPPFDSTWVVRTDRTTGRGDTLTRGVRTRPGYYSTTSGRGSRGNAAPVLVQRPPTNASFSLSATILREVDAVAGFSDGWIAVARFNPYRVDWCPPSQKSCTVGPVIEQRRAYTDAEKRAFLEMYASKGQVPTTDLSRITGWPPTVPPFVQRNTKGNPMRPLRAMPDGRLLIERLETLRTPGNSYDIVDRRGVVVGRMTLPINQRVVGFGAGSIYTAVMDADEVERLRRHPWP
jgi:hypothetical protein